MIVTPNDLYKHAYGKYASGAYNVYNLEMLTGLFRGNLGKSVKNNEPCDNTKSAPFIVQFSRFALSYIDIRLLKNLVRGADEAFPEAIFAVHLDHGDEELCYDCIDSGAFTSVSIDASDFSFERNLEITRRVVERAHDKGVVVEAKLALLDGFEDGNNIPEVKLTDPDCAAEFIELSGCDSLAVAIGTIDGPYMYSYRAGIHFDVLSAIQKAIPANFPLAIHGTSSVHKEMIRRINIAGGQLKQYDQCINEAEFLPASKLGVCKITVDTDTRLLWCAVYREEFILHPEDFDLRLPGRMFMAALAEYVARKNSILGSAGQLESVREFLRK